MFHYRRFAKILDNVSWLLVDRVLRMGVGLFIGAWVARYLGPDRFGVMTYGMAYVGLFAPLATLGLQGIVVRDLVRQPSQAEATLGSAWVLQFAGALLAFALATSMIVVWRPGDEMAWATVAVIGGSLLFQTSAVVRYWFEAMVQSRYVVWVESGALLLLSAVRLALILAEAPLMAFVWAILAESVVGATGLAWVYLRQANRAGQWRISAKRALALLKDAWPLMVSSISVTIFMSIDQFMLGQMVGWDAVGVYSAAIKIAEAQYAVPLIVVASLAPGLYREEVAGTASYLKKIYGLVFWITLVEAVILAAASDILIDILYGAAFSAAGPVLMISALNVVFVGFGIVNGRCLISRGMQAYGMWFAMAGAISNILLNLILIPAYGATGAAVATLVSQALSTHLLVGIVKSTRESYWMQLRAWKFILGPMHERTP